MFSGYSSSRPIAAGILPWPNGRTTLVAKLVLSLDANGAFVPTRGPVPPLQLDVSDDTAELLYASDFAPFKAACDVLVAGAAVRHRGVGVLKVASLYRAIEDHESLGPRQGVCPRGDPLDASVVSAWMGGDVEASRFQSAPPNRRLAWPTQSFRLEYERRGAQMAGNFVGPFVRAIVTPPDCSRILARLPLALDTICLAPEHGRITVLYRGVYDRNYAHDVAELLVLDLEPVAIFDLATISRWPVARLTETKEITRISERSSMIPTDSTRETAFITAPVSAGPVMPFFSPRAIKAEMVNEETTPALRSKAFTLPFVRGAGPRLAGPALTPEDIEALRQQEPVEEGWSARATQFVTAPSRERASFPSAVSPPVSSFQQLSYRPVSPEVPTAKPMAETVSATTNEAAPDDDLETRVSEIMKEIWKGERPTHEILAAYSLTEAEWRVLRRKAQKKA